jgi:threonine dehydrogenase-like Zn-dependent dehydrogenase
MRAVVLRDGRLQVRDTADPVPGSGQLLLRPLSAAICASDVHYMDHPNSAPRFVWDPRRDTILGHEFIGEVVDHGPDCSAGFPIGSRVTSLPLLIREGAEPHVIGHDPDAPGAFGELMMVSEVLARTVPNGVPNDAVAVVDAFAVGEFYVRSSAIGPGELPLVVGAGAIGLSAVAALVARGVGPVIVSDYSAKKFGADVLVNPSERSPSDVWREVARAKGIQKPQVIFECVGAPGLLANIIGSCEFLARLFAAGGWHGSDSVSITEATHKGVTIQFGGGPHPVDWYGTLEAVVDGRLNPLPSIGKVISLDEVPDAIAQARKSQGPPRVVVHPTAS